MKNIETNTNEHDIENETKIKKSICLRLRDCNEKHFSGIFIYFILSILSKYLTNF